MDLLSSGLPSLSQALICPTTSRSASSVSLFFRPRPLLKVRDADFSSVRNNRHVNATDIEHFLAIALIIAFFHQNRVCAENMHQSDGACGLKA